MQQKISARYIIFLRKKKRKLSAVDKELEVIKSVISNVLMQQGRDIFQNSRKRVYTEKEIYMELINIGVESNCIDDCYIFLTKKPD